MNEVKDRIVQSARDLFLKYGIKSITMDEISKEASVSKKTVYQHFKDKHELVLTVTQFELAHEQCSFDEIVGGAENAIEEVFLSTKHIKKHMSKMNPAILFDLKKFHPVAWDYYNNFKKEFLEQKIIDNINKGIDEGNYRKNINPIIVARVRLAQMEIGFDPDWFPPDQHNLLEVQLQLFELFLHGIMTDEAFEIFKNYMNKNEE